MKNQRSIKSPEPAKAAPAADSQDEKPADQPSIKDYDRLRKAVDAEPAVVANRLLLGDLCVRMGRKEEAKIILVRAMEMDPKVRDRVLEILRPVLGEKQIAQLPLIEERIPFYKDATRILKYPFIGNGPALLVGGGVVFTLLGFLVRIASIYAWLPALLIAGYIASYMMTVIEHSARGIGEPPDYPDFLDIWESIVGPFWIATSSAIIPMALPISYWIAYGADVTFVGLVFLGLAYWPMSLVAGAIFQNSVMPINIPFIFRAIRVTAGEYFPAVITIYGFCFTNWILGNILDHVLPGFVSSFVVQTVGLYFMMVQMNLLGKIYYNHDKALAWFPEGTRRMADVRGKRPEQEPQVEAPRIMPTPGAKGSAPGGSGRAEPRVGHGQSDQKQVQGQDQSQVQQQNGNWDEIREVEVP